MNKATLAESVSARLGESNAVGRAAVDAVFDAIVRAVIDGETVTITGFGTFTQQEQAGRSARNPQTGQRVEVPAQAVPKFRAGQGFKDLVSGRRPVPAADVSAIRKASPGAAG